MVGFHVVLRFFQYGESDLSTSLHPVRRLQHVMTGVLVAGIYTCVAHEVARTMVLVPAVLFYLFDFVRRRNLQVNEWFLKHWKNLLRPHEIYDRPPAACFFLLGIMAAYFITGRRNVAYMATLNVALCDPAASVVGILYGKIKISAKKSLEGTLAAGALGALVALMVQCLQGGSASADRGLVGFFIAVLAEVVELPGLDDNFSIPVLTSLLWELAYMNGIVIG